MRGKTTLTLRWIAVLPVAAMAYLFVSLIILFIGHLFRFSQFGTDLVCTVLASVTLISVATKIAPSHKFATALVLTVLNAVWMVGVIGEVIFVKYMRNESDYSSLSMPLWQVILHATTAVAATIYCCNKVYKQDRFKSQLLKNRKAAEPPGAQHNLTLICAPRDFPKGYDLHASSVMLDWFDKVAEQGASRALPEAAEQGDASAQFKLGYCYYRGLGVQKDMAEAMKWFLMSAEQGYTEAQHSLGAMYADGQGVPRDYTEALKWFRKAAEQADVGAQYNLGLMYNYGLGVQKDMAEAMKWFLMSAEQGYTYAQLYLGVMYDNGDGVPKDHVKAATWFRKAAEQGYAVAQYNLGAMYYHGDGVPRDVVEAYKWLNLAQGYEKAKIYRDSVAEKMTLDQIADGQKLSREFKKSKVDPAV